MATVNITLSEFSHLCRLCGSKTSVLLGLHIFEREGHLRQIIAKIKACLPVQVNSTDKLPKMVCEECVYKLDALFEFRERSIKTEYVLNNMLKNGYPPVCSGEPLNIQINSFCGTTQHAENVIHVVQQPELEINLENNSEPLEGIITLPLNHQPNAIKCEPEAIINRDNIVHRIINVPIQKPSDNESENGSMCAEPEVDDSVDMSEEISNNIPIQEISTIALNESEVKNRDAQDCRLFITENDKEEEESEEHKWYFCETCGKPFGSNAEFEIHCESHWKKCSICGLSCDHDLILAQHMKDVHEPKESHQQVEQVIIDVKEPIRTQENEIKKKPEANKKDPKELKPCTECGKEYKTNYKLMEHMRKHTGEKPFKCSMCEKSFRSKIGLAQHEAIHTGQYDYNCSTCNKGFQCKSYLIVHQRVHSDEKPYPCDTCNRHFKTKQSLLDHQNRHLGVKPYICDICGRGFITKGLCKSHQKVHSGQDNRQYPCSVCQKLFVSKSYLTTHLRIHTGEKPFMCEVCGKGFLTRVDLRIHSTMHTGEKSFVCEMCGKAFARRDALRCHKRSHTGERPYKCDICGQGFTQFSPMAIHKRLHTGERPYSCDICGKTFVSRSTMMSHRKKHQIT